MIKIDGNFYRAAMTFASVDAARYYLAGVLVEPHKSGALLVATDGHRLICIHDVNAICEKAAIIKLPPAMLAALSDHDEQNDDEATKAKTLTIDAKGTATIDDEIRSAKSVCVDGKFPDWRKVVGTFAESNGPFQAFNASYLSAFADIAGLLGDAVKRVMFVPGNEAAAPALVLFPGTGNAFGVLMPTRVPKKHTAIIPSFFQLAEIEKAAS